MSEKCNIIEEKLEKHLDQYSSNGKEVLRLAIAVENLKTEMNDHHRFSAENKKAREIKEQEFRDELKPIFDSYEKIQPIIENYNALMTGKKMIIGLAILVSSIGSLYLIISKIFYK